MPSIFKFINNAHTHPAIHSIRTLNLIFSLNSLLIISINGRTRYTIQAKRLPNIVLYLLEMFVNLLVVHCDGTIFTKSNYRKVFHFLLSFNFATSVSEHIKLSHSLNEDDDDKHTYTHTHAHISTNVYGPFLVEKLNYQNILMLKLIL